MFGLFKKKKSLKSEVYSHTTQRKDWEKVLDELFIKVIHPSQNGLAVISNTSKTNERDTVGNVTARLTLRIKEALPGNVKTSIRKVTLQQFAKMFALRSQHSPASYDCYKIKHVGLPNNALIYFIEQSKRKAILVFSSPILQRELQHLAEATSEILKSGEHAVVDDTPLKVPSAIARHQFARTDLKILKERLTYLEDLDDPSPKEQKEREDLEDFVIRHMKSNF